MSDYIATICWAAAMVLFIIIEAATPQLVSIWFAAGALGATVCSLFTKNVTMQFLIFFVITAICLMITRPMANRVTEVKKCPTNADMVIGKIGTVTETIDPIAGSGRVIVMGGTWSAYTQNMQSIPVGQTVKIQKINGVKLLVTPVEQAAEKE